METCRHAMFTEVETTVLLVDLDVNEGAEAVLVGVDRPAAAVPGHCQPAVQVGRSPDGRLPHALHPG